LLLVLPGRLLSQDGPTNRISAQPVEVTVGQPVTLSAAFAQQNIEVPQPDGAEAAAQFFRYVWDFGDGSAAKETAENTTAHAYSGVGTYAAAVSMRAYGASPGPEVPFTTVASSNTVLITVRASDGGAGGGAGDSGGGGGDSGGGDGAGGDDGSLPPDVPLPTVEIVVHENSVPESGDATPENLVLYPGSTVRLACRTEATGVQFAWSASAGLDIDQNGNVRPWLPGTMKVTAKGKVTINGYTYEISDQAQLLVREPVLELRLADDGDSEGGPPTPIFEGHPATVIAEAYPAFGNWTDWKVVWGTELAAIQSTTANGTVVRNDPASSPAPASAPPPGSEWRHQDATVDAKKAGEIVLQAS
jgi:hypothetical protein